MTNPIYNQTISKVQKDLDANVAILVVIDRWGMPTVAAALHPSVEDGSPVAQNVSVLTQKILDLSTGVI